MNDTEITERDYEIFKSVSGVLATLFVMVVAFDWWNSDQAFLEYFVWGYQWMGVPLMLFACLIAGVSAASTQEKWREDGGWSPRVVGNAAVFLLILVVLGMGTWRFVS